MEKLLATIASFFILGLLLVFGLSFLMAVPVMLLWNWLVPAIFGLPAIGYWQAWGLYMLAAILLKPNVSSSSKG